MKEIVKLKISELFEPKTQKKFPCKYFFEVLCSSDELRKIADLFDDEDEIELYCVDIKDIPVINGIRSYVDDFEPAKNKSGIFFFVLKDKKEILYIGSSENLYLTSGGPGVVAQLINGNNSAIADYLTQKIPGTSIDDCSVLFLLLPDNCDIEKFRNKLKAFLKPLIND